jgi:replication factor A1
MAIKDLEVRQGNVDVVAEVIEVGEAREFTKFGRTGKVATAKIKDDTGEVNLSLWNEQVDMVKPGDKIHITNGYVNEFQGELQLTTGKFGKLEVIEATSASEPSEEGVGKAEGAPEAPAEPAEEPKEELSEEPSIEEEKIE